MIPRIQSLVFNVAILFLLTLSWFLSYWVRFDFSVPPDYIDESFSMLPYVIIIQALCLCIGRQIGVVASYFSTPDFLRLAWTIAGSGVLMFALRLAGVVFIATPRGVLLLDLAFSLLLISGVRLSLRLYREGGFAGLRQGAERNDRMAIIGSGEAAASVAKVFLSNPAKGITPVAFFGDNSGSFGKRIHGIQVVGSPILLAQLASTMKISRALIVAESFSARRIKELVSLLSSTNLRVEVLPSQQLIASNSAQLFRTRPIDVEDLLGRDPVPVDGTDISRLIADKVVFVTGAGGSIGSELCRQILSYSPSLLVMIDKSEFALFQIEQEVNRKAIGNSIPVICDILDECRLNKLFDTYKPEVVFHAAAHKHVFMMERHPSEAIKTNSKGTRIVATASLRSKVSTFILISTDKAINPTNIMGAAKRLAEIHLRALHLASKDATSAGVVTRFMAVRFGNVLGSSGSVVPIFKQQIDSGGPVTVTHPEVVRYFMTIPEAVGLVLQSAVLGQGGEIFVLDMGSPVRIVDLAHQMIRLSGLRVGEDIEIVFTGLKPGEKLYEEVRHSDEQHLGTRHPRIMRFVCNANSQSASLFAAEKIEPFVDSLTNDQIKALVHYVIPEYAPHYDNVK